MPIKVTCPKCQGVLHAPDDAGGKRGKCPTCGTVLSIPAEAPRVSAPPVSAPPEPHHPEPEPEVRRSSFGPPPKAAEPEPRRAPAGRLPPPPDLPEPRKPADPFAKPGKRPHVPGVAGDGLVRAWRRARRGLGMVQVALFLCLLGPLALAGLTAAENFGVQLPSQDPGYLGVDGLSAADEIKLAALLGPLALGMLVLLFGRFGVSSAPRSSYAKGLATAAAVATLLTVLGLAAAAVPAGAQLAAGFLPHGFLPAEDPNGVIQRVGVSAAVVFGVLAEVWFVVGLGRIAASLHHPRAAARNTRFLVVVGFLAVVAAVIGLVTIEERAAARAETTHRGIGLRVERPIGQVVQAKAVEGAWNEYVVTNWDKLGEHRPAAEAALIGLGALVLWLWYFRVVGGARRAIREWLEQNEPA